MDLVSRFPTGNNSISGPLPGVTGADRLLGAMGSFPSTTAPALKEANLY